MNKIFLWDGKDAGFHPTLVECKYVSLDTPSPGFHIRELSPGSRLHPFGNMNTLEIEPSPPGALGP